MSPSPTVRSNRVARAWPLILAIGAILCAGAMWMMQPARVIPFDDDFGYLRSVIETIQHQRPWTDDWLEPWAASLSCLAAGVFKITGSFKLATHGVLSLLAGLTFLGIGLVLSRR